MNLVLSCALALGAVAAAGAAEADDPLLESGLLDVTTPPYSADASGKQDATAAIQRAVNDARDRGLVCFFPEGTYLVSDTISCEQEVRKLEEPRHVDSGTQHYWPDFRPIVLLGSTKGKRPVLRLAPDARGFDDPRNPKKMVWIWAQTWFDARGKQEPVWGREQGNISFNHVFKGIDLDIRGHAGAIGIRHSGSQGSTMQDVTVFADGAYAGLNCCPGQGGGTHNVEVVGGRYGIVIEPDSRFPLLNGCAFRGQTGAAVTYAKGGSQVPTQLVGCLFEPAGDTVIDLSTERGYGGVMMIDCVVDLKRGGTVLKTRRPENLFVENTFVRGAASICGAGSGLATTNRWSLVRRFSCHKGQAVNLLNGVESTGQIMDAGPAAKAPDPTLLRTRHYPGAPSFEDEGAVNVRSFGARGDGRTDDTAAFQRAIDAHDKVFVPKGDYRLSGTLRLRARTQLFGLSRSFCSLGSGSPRRRGGEPGPRPAEPSCTIETTDDPTAAPGLFFLELRARVDWRCGQGTWMLTRAPLSISGNGGGRFYGVMAMGRPLILSGIRQPTAFYALNVERVTTNPQSEIRDCANLRLYYFKIEAGSIQRPNAGDANTPCRISNSRNVRVYGMVGNVLRLQDRPMLEIVDSSDLLVCQVKAFRPGPFPHVRETWDGTAVEIPSTTACALLIRDAKDTR